MKSNGRVLTSTNELPVFNSFIASAGISYIRGQTAAARFDTLYGRSTFSPRPLPRKPVLPSNR